MKKKRVKRGTSEALKSKKKKREIQKENRCHQFK